MKSNLLPKRRSRIFTDKYTVTMTPELKQKIMQLKLSTDLDVMEILRRAIQTALDTLEQ